MTTTKVSSFLKTWGFVETSQDDDWNCYKVVRSELTIRIKLDKVERNLVLQVFENGGSSPIFVASFTSDDPDMLTDSILFFVLLNYKSEK